MSIPQVQKAWHATAKGVPAKVLRLDSDVPVPTKLAAGEVLVKVQAAALNPVGYKLMKMLPTFILKRPYIPEHDLAGIIVDANGTGFSDGAAVYGWLPVPSVMKSRQGTLAEYIRVPASHLVHVPSNITPVQASGITLTAMTAYQALFGIVHLEPEQSVFINGGSTAVGAFAIQLAKAVGCKVTASASGKNEAFVRSLGADEFIDYTEGPLHETLTSNPPSPKYHVIFETVGLFDIALYTHSEAYLAPGGTFISTGPQPNGFDIIGIGKLLWTVALQPCWLGGVNRSWRMMNAHPERADLEKIAQYVAEGKVKPLVDSVYSFEDAPKAYERLMTSRSTGKVVIKVDPNVN